nr:MAG TPA: hypothetical protein [Caudoviricetes sp.]
MSLVSKYGEACLPRIFLDISPLRETLRVF